MATAQQFEDQDYVDDQTFENLKSAALTLSRRLARFIRYMRSFPEESSVRLSNRAKR